MRDPKLEEVAKTAAEFHGGRGFANAGRLNGYRCERNPDHTIITVDREPGVTPFTIECRYCRDLGIPGDGLYRHPAMQSAMYRVPDDLTPDHEWYRPDSLDGLKPGEVDHVMKGGLLLRQIAAMRPSPAPEAKMANDNPAPETENRQQRRARERRERKDGRGQR